MSHHSARSVPARGSTAGSKTPRVAIAFTPEMFRKIAAMAAVRGAPFATIVRELCEKALQRREH